MGKNHPETQGKIKSLPHSEDMKGSVADAAHKPKAETRMELLPHRAQPHGLQQPVQAVLPPV
jgi:hypothetical protein